jgi:hypothetical protein
MPGSDHSFCHRVAQAGHQNHFSHVLLNFGRN